MSELSLDCKNVALLGAVMAASGTLGYFVAMKRFSSSGLINKVHQKTKAKVVDSFKTSDMSQKMVFCRCWQSKKFPMCDGAHNEHNKATGDNVAPLIIEKD